MQDSGSAGLEVHTRILIDEILWTTGFINDAPGSLASATLLQPMDLIGFSKGFGGYAPPLQVSTGRLVGTVMRLSFGALEIMYETCNQDLVFEDDRKLVGACIYRESKDEEVHLPGERGLIARPAGSHAAYLLCKDARRPSEDFSAAREGAAGSFSRGAGLFWSTIDAMVHKLSDEVSPAKTNKVVDVPAESLLPLLSGFMAGLVHYRPVEMDHRDLILNRFVALARQSSLAKIESIADSLSMSRRNLHYCASSRLGVAPKRLIKSLAMRDVMCRLPATSPSGQTIADLAFENGFESPAQFSQDYRMHFGERPSDTRRRHI